MRKTLIYILVLATVAPAVVQAHEGLSLLVYDGSKNRRIFSLYYDVKQEWRAAHPNQEPTHEQDEQLWDQAIEAERNLTVLQRENMDGGMPKDYVPSEGTKRFHRWANIVWYGCAIAGVVFGTILSGNRRRVQLGYGTAARVASGGINAGIGIFYPVVVIFVFVFIGTCTVVVMSFAC